MNQVKWDFSIPNFSTKRNIEQVLLESDEFIDSCLADCQDIGLLTGLSGLCIYKYHMWDHFKKKKYLKAIDIIVKKIVDFLGQNETGSTFCSGLAGVGFMFSHLREKGIDYFSNAEIRKAFLPVIEQDFIHFVEQKNFDYLHGAFGLLFFYKIYSPGANFQKRASFLADALRKASQTDFWGRRYDHTEYYQGKPLYGTNLGLSHGIPSYLHILINARSKSYNPGETKELCYEFINFIKSSKTLSQDCYCLFPTVLQKKNLKTNGVELFNSPSHCDPLLAWCYGDLGIGIVLLQVAIREKDSELKRMAEEVLLHSTLFTAENSSITINPFLCHGAAGIMHIYNRAYQYTRNPVFRKSANYWLGKCLWQVQAKEYLKPIAAGEEERVSLLNGLPGASLALLATINPQEPSWDRILLLS